MDHSKLFMPHNELSKLQLFQPKNELVLAISPEGKIIHRDKEVDWNNDADMAEAFRDFIRMQFPQSVLKKEP